MDEYRGQEVLITGGLGFIGWFIRQAIEGAEIQVFGDGQQLRADDYVDDVADAMLIAGMNDHVIGDYFNLGRGQPMTLEAFVQLLLRIAGRGSYRIVPFPPEKKSIDIGSVCSSSAKFNAAKGWTPRVLLDDGLARTVDYYQRYQARYW